VNHPMAGNDGVTVQAPDAPAIGWRRQLGRRMSWLASASTLDILRGEDLMVSAGLPVPRVGLTGAPGAGKSTLGGRLAVLRSQRKRIGLLAIDPSSPVSGGAILGDRIRMDELEGIDRLFVRSLASRTSEDGLAPNISELLAAMEQAGFDELMLETVGVGQVEHAVRHQVDTVVLVLVPGAGDYVQAMKAGVMEMADIFVINKSDLPGAPQMAAEIRSVLRSTSQRRDGWDPPIVLTQASNAATVAELSDTIDKHQAWCGDQGHAGQRQLQRRRYRLRSLIDRWVQEAMSDVPDGFFDTPIPQQLHELIERMREAMPK